MFKNSDKILEEDLVAEDLFLERNKQYFDDRIFILANDTVISIGLAEVEGCLQNIYGDGSGYVSGYVSGDGSGYGFGDGYGDGSGYGDGYGSGFGDGYGYGYDSSIRLDITITKYKLDLIL